MLDILPHEYLEIGDKVFISLSKDTLLTWGSGYLEPNNPLYLEVPYWQHTIGVIINYASQTGLDYTVLNHLGLINEFHRDELLLIG